MTSELDVYRSANLWLERHGDAAVVEARRMVEAMRQRADPSGADAWLRIIVAIEELKRRQLRPGEATN
jgi:hypothetical protein